MIDLYTGKPYLKDRDFDELRSEGKSALSRGRYSEAVELLFAALRGHAQVREDEFSRAALLLRDALLGLHRFAEAISLDWYLGDRESQRELLDRLSPVDRARTLLRWASFPGSESRRYALSAAEHFEGAGQLVRAAIAFEKGADWERARALWSRLANRLVKGPKIYEAALAHFNLSRASQQVGDGRAARAASISAVHLLEEAADRYESTGQRERAFDCFQTLIAIGEEMRVYEHVLEGYVNVTRILCEDHLRGHAIETFQEAINSARAHGELVAAATMAHEMAVFARKEHEPAVANYAILLEAELWRQVAEQSLKRGSPVAVAEHALLAAVLALGELGQYRTVGELYARLAQLKLPATKAAHYARAVKRYNSARNEPVESSPVQLRSRDSLPRFWHDDLIEWEQDGDAAEVCADILISQDNELLRRNALLARLVALAARELQADPQAQVVLCQFLSAIQLYPVVSVFERLLAHPSPRVREEAIKELGSFRYKRTFQSIRVALDDQDVAVVQRATVTASKMRFPHAIEPLSRLYREAKHPEARKAAIRALADIEHIEAAEVLLGILSFGTADDRNAAVEALKNSRKKA
ncbi:MAG: HEAT repeat domain-containing protein, partial [Myxococcales bacterium]|nr:HEAT repeat domain-containing protein [Polyangiaceae bacterium]MDW8251031.1 HEAT repeat domain-containing protein [Myxococcales bacterium]